MRGKSAAKMAGAMKQVHHHGRSAMWLPPRPTTMTTPTRSVTHGFSLDTIILITHSSIFFLSQPYSSRRDVNLKGFMCKWMWTHQSNDPSCRGSNNCPLLPPMLHPLSKGIFPCKN